MEYLKESDANIVQTKQKKSSKIKRKENENTAITWSNGRGCQP